jgi:hypothetical protein
MGELAANQIKFALHGPDVKTDEVSASVFAAKLHVLVGALRAADSAVNGKRVHDYFIAKLHTSTPTAILSERTISHQKAYFTHSGIDGFDACADAISIGDRERALEFGTCAKRIEKLASGAAGKLFGYAEVWTKNDKPHRVDEFLKKRADAMISVPTIEIAKPCRERWFQGAATGSFDGEIRAVDLRGSLPELKLILSAGAREIDCVCRPSDVPTIGDALKRSCRVKISGRAIYDSTQPLPVRLEVSDIKIVEDMGDFLKWRGSFEPFEIEDWPEDDA